MFGGKMTKSAGLLMYRFKNNQLEVFLGHPGGPYWKNKDNWGMPKGKQNENEDDLLQVAIREFHEETAIVPDNEIFIELGDHKVQGKNKTIYAWAFEKNFEGQIKSNEIEIEYPLRSGQKMFVPEMDEGRWFYLMEAKEKIHSSQKVFIEKIEQLYKNGLLNSVKKVEEIFKEGRNFKND